MYATRSLLLAVSACLLAPTGVGGQTCPPDVPPFPVGTAFTYQGMLTFTNPAGQTSPVDDTCDFEFSLWDCGEGGSMIGGPLDFSGASAVDVIGGQFTVHLDFGDLYHGDASFLEVTVTCPAPFGGPETLTPRIELTPTPHALYTAEAPWDGLADVPDDFADDTDDDTLAGLSCADAQIAKWNEGISQWECVASTLDEAYDGVGAGAGRTITADAGPVEILGPDGLAVAGTIQSGTSITIDGTAGRISSSGSMELHVNSSRVLRLQRDAGSPNLIGGHVFNSVTSGVTGAAIGGGGGTAALANRVTDSFATIGGGGGNTVGGEYSTIGGGRYNEVAADFGTVAGGGSIQTSDPGTANRVVDDYGTIGGGGSNQAGSDDGIRNDLYATVAGGRDNVAAGPQSTVGGGEANRTGEAYSTVGGGNRNTASRYGATVPGGRYNTAYGYFSFAAGQRAQANHQGTFVWSDSTTSDPDYFASTGNNQFLIRASGGVGINKNNPASGTLDVAGNIKASGTITSGSSITVDGTTDTITATSGKISFDDEDLVTTGAVGIGITTPTAKLEIAGTPGVDGIKFPDGSVQTTAAAGGLWTASGGNIFYTGGSVGIETDSPQAQLDVNGPARTTTLEITGGSRLKQPLAGWGYNYYGQTDVPAGTFTAVAAGGSHSLAIELGGTLVGRGWNGYGQISVPTGTFTAVAAGAFFSLAIRTDATLAGWGDNYWGQTSVPAGTFAAVAGGDQHSLAIRTDGTLAGWGYNGYGQTDVPAGTFTAVAAGGLHSLAVRTDGTLVGWGNNDYGQTAVPAGTFIAVAAGGWHSLAIRTDGTLVGWGYNASGQTDVPAGTFTAVAAGGSHSLAIRTDGTLAGWGDNDYGQTTVPAGTFIAVAGGGGHSLAIHDYVIAMPALRLFADAAVKPGTNTWTIWSDRRLKKNIQPLGGALERLLQLHGVRFEWIDPASQGGRYGPQIGLIADDVESVFPAWVGRDASGYKTLTIGGFEALTAEALRELRTEKNNEIAALQARLAALEKLMSHGSAHRKGGVQ